MHLRKLLLCSIVGISPLFLALSSTPVVAQSHTSTLLNNGVSLVATTTAGTIEYDFLAPAIGSKSSLGSIVITTNLSGTPKGQITLTPTITAVNGVLTCTGVSLMSSGGNAIYITYFTGTQTVHVLLKPSFDSNFASAAITADSPAVSYVDMGSWPGSLSGHQITVPYSSQAPYYFPSLQTYANAYFDWSVSGTTWLSATRASYGFTTSGTVNTLQETLKLAVSPNFDDVLPLIKNQPSPYVAQLSGKLIVDIWGGSFASNAATLTRLGNYGVTNCVALVHNWQQYGYDNALPAVYPASSSLGGSTGMQSLSSAAKGNSCLFGLHENYADYYPNYPQFTMSAVALQTNGSALLGWLNPSTGIQAYATKPSLYATNASLNEPEIHSDYGTSASFIDVNSSAIPWWRPDMDASAPGAATMASYWNNSIKLWQYERSTHNGPVFGEGKAHWFYSGLLDGVEAQFGAEPTSITIGTKAPLFVDFDVFRIHPLQVNHGMGYSPRWLGSGEQLSSTAVQDAYRMQEIIYGHAPYVNEFWKSPWHVLQEQNLVSPIAQRYGTQTATNVQYDLTGTWSNTNAAILAGDFSRPMVTYANGDSIVANSQSSNLQWNQLTLPQFGWAAKGTNMLAYTALVGGVIADYAQTPSSLFANARNQADLVAEPYSATVQVASFKQTAKGTVQFQLQWNVINGPLSSSAQEFIHLVNYSATTNGAGIVSSAGQIPTTPTNQWTDGLVLVDPALTLKVPGSLPDGTYSVRVGLAPPTGARTLLYGNNDGSGRYILGNLTVSGGGTLMTFSPSNPLPPIASPDLRLNAAGSVVDFGTVRTDGMVWLQQDVSNPSSPKWVMRTYPPYRSVDIEINSSTIPMPQSITCNDGQTLAPTSEGASFWKVDIRSKKYCEWDVQGSGSGTTPASIQLAASSAQGTNPTTSLTGASTTISATVSGSSTPTVAWSLQGGGTLAGNGSTAVYTAPAAVPANPTAVITATLATDASVTASYTLSLLNPTPVISQVGPSPLALGATDAVTISGSGFVPGATVTVNGSTVSSTYQSGTTMTAQIPVGANATGYFSVVVTNPTPGGGASAVYQVPVAAPMLQISAVSALGANPVSAVLGRNTTLTAALKSGATATVTWALQGAGTLTTAGVYTAPAAMPGSPLVTITATLTSNTSITASYQMTLINPVPSIVGLSPSTAPAGSLPFTLGVYNYGGGFVSGSVVSVNGTAVPTTFVSNAQLNAQVTISPSTTAPITVTVFNPAPGGGTSNSMQLPIATPALNLNAASVDGNNSGTARLGMHVTMTATVTGSTDTGITWTLNGAGSLSSAGVYTAPTAMPANPIVTITGSLTSRPAYSASYQFTLINAVPSIVGLSPSTVPTGSLPSTIGVYGGGFVSGSVVSVNGTTVPTTFVSNVQLNAQVTISPSTTAPITVTVFNPAPGGGTSNSMQLPIATPALKLNAASVDGNNSGTARLGMHVTMTATVTGSTDTGITWTLNGAGSLSSTGVYTAPTAMPANPIVTITGSLTSRPAFSATYQFTLINAVPSIVGLSPSGGISRGMTTKVGVYGGGFISGSVVLVNGLPVPTTFVSNVQLAAQVSTGSSTTPLSITVSNPSPGGGTSNAFQMPVN